MKVDELRAQDQREVDFEQWKEAFDLALEGSASGGTAFDDPDLPAIGRHLVNVAEAIADAAVAKVRERRAAAMRGTEPT